ncbi:hypothetical protein E1281_15995 [Actinomadura sp. KC345]|uniref:sugar transferase n=1 Tax=Actinomadura sp. KC345 TaxID=2530371 RepID=UPI00104CB89E|nr:sugar transferase [Actinomadura sp. KC345]TDC54667.1 hypothetical protein E1281_15995 [Actinomadura sp. KC345]
MNDNEALHALQRRLKAIRDMPGSNLTGPDWILSPEKRRRDLLIATALLPLYVPVAAAGASLVFLGDGKAPLFRQQRIGQNGVPFDLLHVRTMRDARGRDASRGSADPRALRRAKILRKVTADQFVELVNVFHGDMSITNPRPLLEDDRRLMKNALPRTLYREWTWASTIGRPGMYSTFGNESIRWVPKSDEYLLRRAECDIEDAHNASPARDMKILGDTARIGWSFLGGGS